MFYDALTNAHGLERDPFKALVVPRPIGWISTLSPDGIANLAPYSYFNAVGDNPHCVMFSSAGRKDSQRNIEATGEFVCSMATWELREAMNRTSAPMPPEVDEFAEAGLTPTACRLVKPPRVGESPVALECRHHQTVELPGPDGAAGTYTMLIGVVIGIHIADEAIVDGRVDTAALRPIARLGYMDYAVVDTVFQMTRPTS